MKGKGDGEEVEGLIWPNQKFCPYDFGDVCVHVKSLPRQATDTDGRLHIPQVTVQDSGQYVCTALDAAAGAEPATVTLIVDDSCMIALFIL